jgi:hypothetical protein
MRRAAAVITAGGNRRCYNAAMPISDEQIREELTATGFEIGRYFICDDSIYYRAVSGQLSFLLIEDEDHARATRDYLIRIGAEVLDELPPAAPASFPFFP